MTLNAEQDAEIRLCLIMAEAIMKEMGPPQNTEEVLKFAELRIKMDMLWDMIGREIPDAPSI